MSKEKQDVVHDFSECPDEVKRRLGLQRTYSGMDYSSNAIDFVGYRGIVAHPDLKKAQQEYNALSLHRLTAPIKSRRGFRAWLRREAPLPRWIRITITLAFASAVAGYLSY